MKSILKVENAIKVEEEAYLSSIKQSKRSVAGMLGQEGSNVPVNDRSAGGVTVRNSIFDGRRARSNSLPFLKPSTGIHVS